MWKNGEDFWVKMWKNAEDLHKYKETPKKNSCQLDFTVHELLLGVSLYFQKLSKFFHTFNLVKDSCHTKGSPTLSAKFKDHHSYPYLTGKLKDFKDF